MPGFDRGGSDLLHYVEKRAAFAVTSQ